MPASLSSLLSPSSPPLLIPAPTSQAEGASEEDPQVLPPPFTLIDCIDLKNVLLLAHIVVTVSLPPCEVAKSKFTGHHLFVL